MFLQDQGTSEERVFQSNLCRMSLATEGSMM